MNGCEMKYLFLILLIILICRESSLAQDEFHHPELTWRTIETEHFFVHYHEGAERTARTVAKIAEEIYEPITSLYNHAPDQKISFVIKDYDDYSNGAAYFYDNVVEIWATSMDFDLRGTHNWLRNVVTHEFTHIVQIQTAMKFGRKVPAFYIQWLGYEAERRPDVLYGYPNTVISHPISGFNVPAWFAEGVAQYNRPELAYDFWDTHRDMILRMYALDGNMLTWNEMAVFGKTSLGNESSYNAGFAFVNYIAERYGIGKLEDISRNLSSLTALTIDEAMKRSLGKDGAEVYNDWVKSLRDDYSIRSSNVKNHLIAGEIIAGVGFGNFYPTFSPDGRNIAYVSNKEADYFSPSSIYLYNVETKQEKKLVSGVRSNLSWSPDGKKIYYTKTTRRNKYWSDFHDIYVYDLEQEEETRLTYGVRANSPAVSPDGGSIAYVAGSDGTLNLFVMNFPLHKWEQRESEEAETTTHRQLTTFGNGEQVYNPKWSPDGNSIVFDYSIKDGRDVGLIAVSGGDVQFLLHKENDARNPIFTLDGKRILFVADRTGIFNIYEYDVSTRHVQQITNVLGGAFMPSVSGDGKLAFASYTSTGYKIALLEHSRPMPVESLRIVTQYAQVDRNSWLSTSGTHGSNNVQSDWHRLREYDDRQLRENVSREYSNIFTNMSFVPFLRVDNYNPKNKGVDIIKPGLYAFSRDVLEKMTLFAGAAINRIFERDLFFIFNYFDRVPGLFDLSLNPGVSIELYNVTRKTEANATLGVNTLRLGVTYSLLQFDFALGGKLLIEPLETELRFTHSRYTSTLEFPPGFGGPQIIRVDDLYFIGNDVSSTWRFTEIARSRTQEINPVGRKVKLRYNYEFNKFNPDNKYEIQNGIAVPLYTRFNFHRLELNWREHVRLPGWKHTLSAHVRGGSILGPPVHQFFDFYIGGLAGIKGYPFYSLGGNEMASLNLTYRFPLWENIDIRLLYIYFDKLYAAVFADVGDTWTGSPKGNKFKRDVGFELRLESFSWYAYPTRIFFSGAYGLDQFNRFIDFDNTTVTYGKEWRFYFGVLFGFDLD
jgi:Tol biopolymer transport system component